MTIRNLRRLGCRAVLGGGLFLGWAGTGALHAQPTTPGAVPPAVPVGQAVQAPARNFLNKRTIQLPIQINDSARSSIKEIQLHVKDSPTSPWVKTQSVPTTQKSFTFEAPRDGEFWFTMVTVDNKGVSHPADVRNEPAALAVVIDTQAPVVDMTNLGMTAEGQMIQVDVADMNLDIGRLRFSYEAGDKAYRMVEPVPGRTNVYCIPSQAVCTGMIQLIAEDLAGNQTTRQEHLSKLKTPHAETSTPPAGAVAKGSPGAPNELPRGMNTVPMMGASETHQVQKVTPSYPSPSERMTLPRPNGNEGPHWIDEKQGDSAKTGATQPRQSNDLMQTSSVGPKTSTGPALQPAAATKNAALKTQMVNKTKISLDFQIENAAPTGVARVDVWLSRDQGQTWQKHAEENGSKSPIEVQFPGDGVYGLILSPRSAATPSTPPTAADQADAVWLEVDATKPALQIKDIQSSHENGQAIVQIRWSAQDKNLAEGPVDLFYAATPQGPWLLIAKGLPAEGMHRWTPPAGIGAQTHLQLIARDAAGNASVCGTLEPVTIAEPAHPRAVIRTISTGGPQLVP